MRAMNDLLPKKSQWQETDTRFTVLLAGGPRMQAWCRCEFWDTLDGDGWNMGNQKKKCITGHTHYTHSTFVTYGPYGINFCAQVCPNCGRVYAYDAQYCRHCGQKREARDVKMLPLLNGPYSVLTVLYRRWNSSDKFLTSNRKNNANAYTKPDSCLQQLVITIFKILNDIWNDMI